MKNVYLVAAILGAVIPYIFFLDFFQAEGLAITSFAAALFSNGASGGFVADILLSSAVFWIYLFSKQEKGIWLYILLNMTIGLSCALPFYLYRKTKESEATDLAAA